MLKRGRAEAFGRCSASTELRCTSSVDVARSLPTGCVDVARSLPDGCVDVARSLPAGGVDVARSLPAGCVDKARSLSDGVADVVRSLPDVDLNCRENVSLNSDSDEHSDDETIENKVFPQQRFSPVISAVHPGTLRPRPVKGRAATDGTLMSNTSALRPPGTTRAFQPHGEVFKARATVSKNSSG